MLYSESHEIKPNNLQKTNDFITQNHKLLFDVTNNIYDIDFGMLQKYRDSINSLNTNISSFEQETIDRILSIYVYGQRPVEIVSAITEHLKNISDEQSKARIALGIAIKDGRRLSEYFDLFGIEDEATKINIGIACAFTHARRLSKHIKSFNIKEEKNRYQLATLASFNDGPNVLDYFDNYEIYDEKYKRKILATSLLNNPSSISFAHKLLNAQMCQLKYTEGTKEILKWLKSASEKNQNIIPIETETVYNDMQRRDAGLRLLAGYLLGEKVQSPAESLNVLTGIPIFSSKELNLANSFGDLLETILELQSKYFEPFFSEISTDKTIFEDYKSFKGFIEFTNFCNLLTQIQGSQSCFHYKNLTKELSGRLTANKNTSIVTNDNIKSASDFIQEKFLEEIGKKTTGLGLDYEKVIALKDLWGDITPFVTLIARYNGKKERNQALQDLIKIANEVIGGSFVNYKYFGNKDDSLDFNRVKDQIGMLNQAQLDARMENPSSIKLLEHNSESILSYAELESILIKLRSQILTQTNDYRFETISDFLSLSDKDLTKKLKTIYGNNRENMLLNCIDTILLSKDMEGSKKIISKIKSLKDILLTHEKHKTEIIELSKKLYSKNTENEILFTTFFDSPKLTLTINNLIKNASCFNYNNGVEVQALMSYVMDANIKCIAGFTVSPSNIPNFSDFQSICKAIKSTPEKVSHNFEPEKMILHIVTDNRTFDVKLQNVFYKRFVKIGKTLDGDIGLALEVPHTQDHRMINIIEEETKNLFIKQSHKIGAKVKSPIHIPESRSLLGSYSDIAVGRKLGPYIMPVD